uniref:Retrotransposon gag domain-containing protein n=1 Tax=Fagus sylvatica TaxID=28930 RepID=A0A2N9IMF6_FAGSY
MAGHHHQGYNMEDHDGGHTNFEMDELRRQLQELQQRLEQYENQGRGARHHDSESDNENPFHHAHSHSSGKMQPDDFIDWLITVERIFEKELKRKYLPEHYKQDAFMKFHNFKQRELSVEEYTAEFDHLMIRCDVVEQEEQMIARYLAMKVEKQLKEKRGNSFRSFTRDGVSNCGSDSTSKTTAIPKTAAAKPTPKNEATSKDMEMEDEDDFSPETNEHVAMEEEITYADREGGSCGSKKPQRSCENVVVATMVENVVAATMVEKLKLKIEDHLEPYKLQWLRKGNEVKGTNLLTRSGVEKALMENGEGFAIMVKEEKEPTKIPPSLIPFLKEFSDVVPKEIPHGFPPMRDMQHCIDLVPGSMLPNKLAYRLNPKEHEELQRQVE